MASSFPMRNAEYSYTAHVAADVHKCTYITHNARHFVHKHACMHVMYTGWGQQYSTQHATFNAHENYPLVSNCCKYMYFLI